MHALGRARPKVDKVMQAIALSNDPRRLHDEAIKSLLDEGTGTSAVGSIGCEARWVDGPFWRKTLGCEVPMELDAIASWIVAVRGPIPTQAIRVHPLCTPAEVGKRPATAGHVTLVRIRAIPSEVVVQENIHDVSDRRPQIVGACRWHRRHDCLVHGKDVLRVALHRPRAAFAEALCLCWLPSVHLVASSGSFEIMQCWERGALDRLHLWPGPQLQMHRGLWGQHDGHCPSTASIDNISKHPRPAEAKVARDRATAPDAVEIEHILEERGGHRPGQAQRHQRLPGGGLVPMLKDSPRHGHLMEEHPRAGATAQCRHFHKLLATRRHQHRVDVPCGSRVRGRGRPNHRIEVDAIAHQGIQ
mmetsp:Transcript_48650/g.122757  ORF Transcript_48650/g.122757 Transcript_48650/m.122757 type:complete len:359 (+) Transcript_48650:16-1092(+)